MTPLPRPRSRSRPPTGHVSFGRRRGRRRRRSRQSSSRDEVLHAGPRRPATWTRFNRRDRTNGSVIVVMQTCGLSDGTGRPSTSLDRSEPYAPRPMRAATSRRPWDALDALPRLPCCRPRRRRAAAAAGVAASAQHCSRRGGPLRRRGGGCCSGAGAGAAGAGASSGRARFGGGGSASSFRTPETPDAAPAAAPPTALPGSSDRADGRRRKHPVVSTGSVVPEDVHHHARRLVHVHVVLVQLRLVPAPLRWGVRLRPRCPQHHPCDGSGIVAGQPACVHISQGSITMTAQEDRAQGSVTQCAAGLRAVEQEHR